MLSRILRRAGRIHGEREALTCGGERYTYAELWDRVCRCAAGLEHCGVGTDRGVALVLKNSPQFVLAMFAAASLGARVLLLDPDSKPTELTRALNEHPLAAVVCEPALAETLGKIRQTCAHSFRIFVRGDDFDSLSNHGSKNFAERMCRDQIATVQYSSGSTGIPKCVARSHRNLYWEARNFHRTVKVVAEDRILCAVPLFHAHGFSNAMLAAFYAGAALVLVEEFNRAEILRRIADDRITVLPSVPFILDLLSTYLRGESAKLRHSLRLVFTAGAPLSLQTARNFQGQFGIYPRQLYGSTELGSASINLSPDVADTLTSVGQPMHNVRIRIFRQDGVLAVLGEVGEIGVQSPAMPDGYFHQPDLTHEKFRNGFFFPGDLGRITPNGHLYIVGRTSVLVSSAGKKVDPCEVEKVIADHPKVSEVVVVGVPGRLGDSIVKAVVVLKEDCQEQEIVNHCREKLSDFKIPRVVEFVSQIPRSPSGKILRKNLLA